MREFFGRRTVRVAGIVALVVVGVFVLFLLLNLYIAPTKPSQRKDLVLAVAQILGGTALLLGLYFTWRTLQVNREGQITERFTRAIDQLGKVDNDGKKVFEIRLGAIYALEQIARESKEDYWPIMEILTAYVRENAPWPPEEGQGDTPDATEEQSAMHGPGENSGEKSETTEHPSPDLDIQAIMTVLRRRRPPYRHGEPDPLDLRGADLGGADLRDADLRDANLRQVDSRGADFSGALVERACLSGVWLGDANFWRTSLKGADLRGANLSEARNISQPQLEETRIGTEDALLPPDLNPPAHWGMKTEEQTEED